MRLPSIHITIIPTIYEVYVFYAKNHKGKSSMILQSCKMGDGVTTGGVQMVGPKCRKRY